MKIEKWWRCLGCNLAYKHLHDATSCHGKGVERVSILVDDKGMPTNALNHRDWRANVEEDETFGLINDLVGPP